MGSSSKNMSMSCIMDADRLQVMELGMLCHLPMALNAAVKLNVFEIVLSAGENAQLSASEIIARIQPACKSPSAAAIVLGRILRVLASRGILKEVAVPVNENNKSARKYSLTNVSKYLVKDKNGLSLTPWILFNQDEIFMKTWQFLYDAVVEGDAPFTRAHGVQVFDLAGKDGRLNELLNLTMASHSSIYIRAVLEVYDGFKDAGTLVDVGGGCGVTLGTIVSAYPNIKGINFDLEHVLAEAPSIAGVEHVGGDMFERVPEGDAIFMKWILHDWADEDCIKLLKNCWKSLPDHGKVIIMDAVLPAEAEHDSGSRFGLSMDVLMLAYTSAGKERTEDEFNHIAKEAGFAKVKVVLKMDFIFIVEMYKA